VELARLGQENVCKRTYTSEYAQSYGARCVLQETRKQTWALYALAPSSLLETLIWLNRSAMHWFTQPYPQHPQPQPPWSVSAREGSKPYLLTVGARHASFRNINIKTI
jgi:hypothetical protein